VEVAVAGSGSLAIQISLPGEIVLNADRVAHVVPRAPGIVREVLNSVGDAVQAGEVLAWLESAELGEAKVDYLAKWAEVSCCKIDLTRAQEVHDNTLRLLQVLESAPSLKALRDMDGIAMGENRSILVSAYAEFVYSEAAYQREKPLFEKKVASERDFQASEAEYKKADALYAATRDSVEFKIRRDLLEAKRAQQVRAMELKGAERHLYVLGLKAEDVKTLELLARGPIGQGHKTAECNDPNCKDCARPQTGREGQTGESDRHRIEERLAWYPLRAPFDGLVIEKHLTLGEKHGDDSNAFTVADLSSVWVDINVFQKDLPHVSKGQTVWVSTVGGTNAQGAVAFVAPIVDHKTRTALARMVLPNPDRQWRPGLFVNAELAVGGDGASVVIPADAVQRMGGQAVVFVDEGDEFRAAAVSLGRRDATRVEILSGLSPGERVVVEGAFELKAKIVTSGLGAHAGHGH
jgi:cobalt-zinc-cadmium efflux system membrane fusion protein